MKKPKAPPPAQQQQLSLDQALTQAHAHWNAGQVDQAERLCQHVLAMWPGQSDACHLMGLMAHAYGNLEVAIDHLTRACQAPRVPATYLSNLAEMCRQAGRLAEAEAAGRRAVASDPMLVGGWNNLGIVLQEAGKLEESLTCLEQVVALKPDFVEAQNNLGNTLKRMGRLAEAQRHYEIALALAPSYAEALSNLANLATHMGDPERGLTLARKALDHNPRLAEAYINAAAAELSRGRDENALRWIDKLLAFAPQHAGALAVRAVPLRHLERMDEALDSARRAVTMAPGSGEALQAMAESLQALGRTTEALGVFDRAAAAPGLAAEKALVGKAICLMEAGEKAQARIGFEAALARFPASVSAWFNLADLDTFKPGDPAIASMEALLGSPAVQAQNDRTALHFALAKAYLDVGDPDRAFRLLHEGNRLKRATFAYDADDTERWLNSIIDAYPAASFTGDRLVLSGQVEPGSMPAPVFVVGMPRSGTTLVEQVLASHRLVATGGEMTTLSRILEAIGPFPARFGNIDAAERTAIGRSYLHQVALVAGGRPIVVDKMPSNFLHAGLIVEAIPQARIIHVRRDALDTCLSCYTKLFTREQQFSYDLTELGRFHRGYERLMAYWRRVLPADRFTEIAYEDLVADFEPQARRLVAFIGLEWDPACTAFYETRRVIRTASLNQVREPVHNRSVGRAKRYAAYLKPLTDALAYHSAAGGENPVKRTRRRKKDLDA
jgi:tetratricopeptide (TPR) repeat protein